MTRTIQDFYYNVNEHNEELEIYIIDLLGNEYLLATLDCDPTITHKKALELCEEVLDEEGITYEI